MKKLISIAALAATIVAQAEDTDCGALITTSNIEGTAKVQNLTGADAGKATITINNNSGTANSVTVYNAATVDTALSGKASTGDITALQNRATALETATNNLTTAVAGKVSKNGDTMTGNLVISSGNHISISEDDGNDGFYSAKYYGSSIDLSGYPGGGIVRFPLAGDGYLAFASDIPTQFSYTAITNAPWLLSSAISSWALASTKPSYNFSEIGSKPTTISGYGITDAKIANGVITLGANTITPVTTETDPVWSSEKSGYVPTSRKVAGMALSSDITLKNLSIVGSSTTTYNGSGTASVNQTTQTQTSTTQSGTTGKNLTIQVAATSLDMGAYYIKIGSDGKPHLMLRQ